jgi:queuine tRNA-ribosyltransferase
LDRCGEMLGSVLNTIHNLHYYLQLMSEVRLALETDSFTQFVKSFTENRQRGV